MNMTDARLAEFAQLVVEIGLNVQKGQTVCIRAPYQLAPLAELCASAAYDVGAREVLCDLTDGAMTRMRYLRADDAIFDHCPAWHADKFNTLAAEGAAFLSIAGDDPDMLQGVDPGRLQRNARAYGAAMQPYQARMMSNQSRWCVIAAPSTPWAEKVFPALKGDAAVDALWEAILKTMRINGDSRAVERWHAHSETTAGRAASLNAMQLASVHFCNSLGTDLTIGLPDGVRWAGGAENDAEGIPFIANMPTEEIFTAPHRERVQGRAVSAMPFVLNGNVIERFAFTFENGRIVGIEADNEADRAALQAAITVDEGASYLGEVALVGYDSPIAQMHTLFYNTLFDENAACHLAFGKAYPCIEGGEEMDADALKAAGLNDSFTHNDFMIGTKDLTITGTTKDGRTVAIFTDGNFAF